MSVVERGRTGGLGCRLRGERIELGIELLQLADAAVPHEGDVGDAAFHGDRRDRPVLRQDADHGGAVFLGKGIAEISVLIAVDGVGAHELDLGASGVERDDRGPLLIGQVLAQHIYQNFLGHGKPPLIGPLAPSWYRKHI